MNFKVYPLKNLHQWKKLDTVHLNDFRKSRKFHEFHGISAARVWKGTRQYPPRLSVTALGTFEQISALLNSSHCLPTDVLPDDEHKARIRNSNKRAYTYGRSKMRSAHSRRTRTAYSTARGVGRGCNETVVSSVCVSNVTISIPRPRVHCKISPRFSSHRAKAATINFDSILRAFFKGEFLTAFN